MPSTFTACCSGARDNSRFLNGLLSTAGCAHAVCLRPSPFASNQPQRRLPAHKALPCPCPCSPCRQSPWCWFLGMLLLPSTLSLLPEHKHRGLPGEYLAFARNIGCKNEPDLLATPLAKYASAARMQPVKLPGKGENQADPVPVCSHLSVKVWGRNCLAINYYLGKKQIMGLAGKLNKLLWGPG